MEESGNHEFNKSRMNETNIEESFNKKLTHGRFFLIGIVIVIIFLSIVLFLEFESVTRDLSFGDIQINWLPIVFVLILIVLLISVFIVLSYKEYWEYFSYRRQVNKGYHTLSIDDLFENENRKNIIKAILAEPGIHNNELLKRCNLQKGQLQWHLQVLLQYNIIKIRKFFSQIK